VLVYRSLVDDVENIESVDWSTLHIVETHDDEGHIVPCSNWSAEVWDHSHRVERHIVKLHQRTCSCLEWQHTGKPCQHVLAYATRQLGVDLEKFVHEYCRCGI
jgi:hypothetical protein